MRQLQGALAKAEFPAELIALVLAGVLLVLGAIFAWRKWQASRVGPAELERQRRKILVTRGKMGDATLVEIRDTLVFYSYQVRGIEYLASQDVGGLYDSLPEDPDAVGPVAVKYDPRNPANSIIISEEWSGIRKTGVRG